MNRILFFSFTLFLAASLQAKQIDIFFGYIDQHPSDQVIDAEEAQWLISLLTVKCQSSTQICGFTEDPLIENLFIKNQIQIRIFNPSVTNSDLTNRQQYRSEQNEKSERIRKQFVSSLIEADHVIYVGHSRYGYGPDFNLGLLDQKNKIDQNQYQQRAPQHLAEMQIWLDASRAKSLSLISCSSQGHFQDLRLSHSQTNLNLVHESLRPTEARALLAKNLKSLLQY
jgi:hypothetical protein